MLSAAVMVSQELAGAVTIGGVCVAALIPVLADALLHDSQVGAPGCEAEGDQKQQSVESARGHGAILCLGR